MVAAGSNTARARAAASAGPSVAFVATNWLCGATAAIAVASVASVVLVALRHRQGRAVGWFLPASLLYVAGRGVVGVVTGSDDLYFGAGLVVSAVVAVAVLATAITASPAATAVIPLFVDYSPCTVEHPRFRRVAGQVTVVWAVCELSMTAWEAHHLATTSAGEFLGLRILVGWPAMAAAVCVLVFYVRLRLDPLEMAQRDRSSSPGRG